MLFNRFHIWWSTLLPLERALFIMGVTVVIGWIFLMVHLALAVWGM